MIAVGSISLVGPRASCPGSCPCCTRSGASRCRSWCRPLVLLISGVYYAVNVLPGWLQAVSRMSRRRPTCCAASATRSSTGGAVGHEGGTLGVLAVFGLVLIPALAGGVRGRRALGQEDGPAQAPGLTPASESRRASDAALVPYLREFIPGGGAGTGRHLRRRHRHQPAAAPPRPRRLRRRRPRGVQRDPGRHPPRRGRRPAPLVLRRRLRRGGDRQLRLPALGAGRVRHRRPHPRAGPKSARIAREVAGRLPRGRWVAGSLGPGPRSPRSARSPSPSSATATRRRPPGCSTAASTCSSSRPSRTCCRPRRPSSAAGGPWPTPAGDVPDPGPGHHRD